MLRIGCSMPWSSKFSIFPFQGFNTQITFLKLKRRISRPSLLQSRRPYFTERLSVFLVTSKSLIDAGLGLRDSVI